jgi:chromosome segregation ATPase
MEEAQTRMEELTKRQRASDEEHNQLLMNMENVKEELKQQKISAEDANKMLNQYKLEIDNNKYKHAEIDKQYKTVAEERQRLWDEYKKLQDQANNSIQSIPLDGASQGQRQRWWEPVAQYAGFAAVKAVATAACSVM